MRLIPILTDESFRILAAKQKQPRITARGIALKMSMPVEHVQQQLEKLRMAKFLDAQYQPKK